MSEIELTGVNEAKVEEILRGISFGVEGIRAIFKGARWTFYPDEKFTFTPLFESNTSISGTYTKVDSKFEFRGERISEFRTVSIDGTIHLNEENPVLDAICADSQSPQRIVRISQVLAKGRLIQETEPVSRPKNTVRTEKGEISGNFKIKELDKQLEKLDKQLEAFGIDSSVLEKEIEEITIPSQFSISLEGKTDKGVFGTLSGDLFISEPPSKSRNPLSVSLGVNSNLHGTNGWIYLSSEEAGQGTPNISIQANSGQVHLELSPSEIMRSSTYTYTLGPDESNPELPVLVLIEEGTLTFSIEGDRISGEIKVSGIHFPAGADEYFSDAEQSTYEAKLTGEIPKSPPVEKLKASLAFSFNGQWNTGERNLAEISWTIGWSVAPVGAEFKFKAVQFIFSRLQSAFGQIKLQQNGQQVRGTYTGAKGGTIEGIARGDRLDFTWQAHQKGEKGRGFFRAINGGGKLVGIIWGGEDSTSQTKGDSLIRYWELPPDIAIKTFSPFDLQELRYLGQELANRGRYEQAALLLNEVISSYLYLAKQQEQPQGFETASVEKERELEGYLTSAGFSLNFLIDCHFKLGDYNQLLKSLDYGLEIQRILGPEESASRLFRQRTAQIAETLTSNAEQFEFMENGYRVCQQMVSGSLGVVGISVEQDKTTQELIVSSTEEGQPAYLAGIVPKDTILKIDGNTTQGMDEQQVTERLGGKPETPVTITVRRGNRELEFQLTRAKIEISSAQHQAKLVEALTFFANSLNRLRERSKNNLYKINTLADKIAQGREKPVSALLSVSQYIKNQIIQLNEETNALLVRGREVFSQQQEALQELEFIFSKLKDVGKGAEIDIRSLDVREERMMQLIENDKDLSPIEKQLFKAYKTGTPVCLKLSFELESEKNYIDKTDVEKLFEENRKRSLKMTASLTDRIESWRTRLVEDFDKIDALDQAQSVLQKASKFFISSLNYQEEALVIAEKSRARAFADLLVERSSSNLESLSKANAPTPKIGKIKEIAQFYNATIVEYSIIKDYLKDSEGKYDDRESELFIWVINPRGEVSFSLVDLKPLWQKLNLSLSNLVIQTRQYLGLDKQEDGGKTLITNPLRTLYQYLIKPIVHLLPTDKDKLVIFIPQEELFLLPFSALQYAKDKFLIEKYTSLIAPSIQILDVINQSQKTRHDSLKALVVGNPFMPSLPPENGKQPKPLPELPGSGAEALAIASLLNTEAIIGAAATKVDIAEQMTQAGLIHLATHGLLEKISQLTRLGAIALAPSKKSDGFLTGDEIYNMKLQAELMILSACKTGKGKITGDGVIGLSRCSMVAGIPRIIVSLWSVSDLSTAFLMVKFYEILKNLPSLQPGDAAKALNQSQRWLLTLKREEARQELEKLKPYIYQSLIAAGKSEKAANRKVQAHITGINNRPSCPFAEPSHWAAFTTIGL